MVALLLRIWVWFGAPVHSRCFCCCLLSSQGLVFNQTAPGFHFTMANEKFCLRWNDFEQNISVAFRELRDDKDFFDVTLACDDEQIEAHKVILSACSPFFRRILRKNSHAHPLLYLKGVKFNDLQSVLNFMYHGEVNVAQEELNSFLSVAEELHVKGLTQGQQSGGSTSHTDSQNAKKTSSSVPVFKPRPPDPPQRSRTIRPPQEVRDEVEEVPMPSVKSEVVAQAEYEEEEEGGNYEEDYGEQFLGESGQDYAAMQPHDPTKGDF